MSGSYGSPTKVLENDIFRENLSKAEHDAIHERECEIDRQSGQQGKRTGFSGQAGVEDGESR